MDTSKTLLRCWRLAEGAATTFVTLKQSNTIERFVEAVAVLKSGAEEVVGIARESKRVWKSNTGRKL